MSLSRQSIQPKILITLTNKCVLLINVHEPGHERMSPLPNMVLQQIGMGIHQEYRNFGIQISLGLMSSPIVRI